MADQFSKLSVEKQKRIINAALKEFSLKGYRDASTNEIVKEANISKGSLFHYFVDKKSLYMYLYDYSINEFMSEFTSVVNYEDKDYLNRLYSAFVLKINMIKKHPDLFDFLLKVTQESDIEISTDILDNNIKVVKKGFEMLYSDLDKSMFKEDFELSDALNLIEKSFYGLGMMAQNEIRMAVTNDDILDKYFKQADEMLKLLRKVLYKNQ